MKARFQGKCNACMIGENCWFLKKQSEKKYYRRANMSKGDKLSTVPHVAMKSLLVLSYFSNSMIQLRLN